MVGCGRQLTALFPPEPASPLPARTGTGTGTGNHFRPGWFAASPVDDAKEPKRTRLCVAEKRSQLDSQFLRRFLGHVVAAVEAATHHVVGPTSPDAQNVAVKFFEVIAC